MLYYQLPALLRMASFWDALPEIFDWLHGWVAVAPPLPAMPVLNPTAKSVPSRRSAVLKGYRDKLPATFMNMPAM
jgi:hypothetical protein